MSKPYDATLKAMLEAAPADWSQLVGLQASRVEIIDADLSTVTAATDKALRLHEPDAILAFDFQAGPDPSLSQRVHCYNTLLRQRDGLPVRSVVVLLRPEAKLNSINGTYEERFLEEEQPYLTFRYQIVRVWELPAERLLAGGLGTLPLAPISAVTEADLPGIIEQLKEKLGKLEPPELAGQLWTEIDVLMGLRYERALVEHLLQGVQGMEESVTYQAIVEKRVAKQRFPVDHKVRIGKDIRC